MGPSSLWSWGVILGKGASIRREPVAATALVKSLALPRDMELVNAASLDENFLELHNDILKVSPEPISICLHALFKYQPN